MIFMAVHECEVEDLFSKLCIGVSCDSDELGGVIEREKVLIIELASGPIEENLFPIDSRCTF